MPPEFQNLKGAWGTRERRLKSIYDFPNMTVLVIKLSIVQVKIKSNSIDEQIRISCYIQIDKITFRYIAPLNNLGFVGVV